LIRLLSILVLAAALRGCVTYEFEHEFWLNTDGSGSFVVTAPPWVWNAAKNVGEARDPGATVNERTVLALFQDAAIRNPRVREVTRGGRPYITVAADFSDLNALSRTKAFPDLQIALRREGERLLLSGAWRRPEAAGAAQGDVAGLMAVRFHLPSEIFEHRNAYAGVERGNILSWRRELREGMAGAPIEFGAAMGARSVLSATLGLFGLAILTGLGMIASVLFYFTRRGRAGGREVPSPVSPVSPKGPPIP
jgi:hypothetical protein